MIGARNFDFVGSVLVFLGVEEVDRYRVEGVEVFFNGSVVCGAFVGSVVTCVWSSWSGGEVGGG